MCNDALPCQTNGVSYQCIDATKPNENTVSEAIFAGHLLPDLNGNGTTTAQFVIIKGQLFVDNNYNFAAGSEIIFLTENGGLFVNAGQTLKIRGTTIHGCNALWKSISGGINCVIDIQDCPKIADAQIGIFLPTKGKITIKNNVFSGCATSVSLGNENPLALIKILSDGIVGNTFDGAGNLIPNSFGVEFIKPTYAVVLNNLKDLFSIGQSGIGKKSNLIKNYTYSNPTFSSIGILLHSCVVSIENTKFENIKSSTGTVIAIFAGKTSELQQPLLTFKGLGKKTSTSTLPTFNNVDFPISMYDGNLDVSHTYVHNCVNGVSIYTSNSLGFSNFKIKNCSFDEFSKNGISANSAIDKIQLLNSEISNCDFDDNLNQFSSDLLQGRSSINFLSIMTSMTAGKIIIKDNKFTNRLKTLVVVQNVCWSKSKISPINIGF
jgi:hypothetical protein